MAKRGRPATGKHPVIAVRVPPGWLKQIERMGDKSTVARMLIGSALAARKVKGGDGVTRIDAHMARAFIELWHYAGALPTGKNITFGWFVTGELYAVACYGNGGNMDGGKFLAKLTGFPVTRTNLVELRRLCRSEPPRPDYPLSQFIAACHRLLKRDHGKRFVVSYSDPAHGHNGGIYKASNFRHLGRTGDGYHTADRKGQIVHRRRAYRLAKREGISTAAARKRLGLKVQRTMGRDRWLLDIGPTTGRQAPTVAVQRAGRRGSVPARLTPPRESW